MFLAHVAEQETENHILSNSSGIIERDGVPLIPIITKLPLARRRESNPNSNHRGHAAVPARTLLLIAFQIKSI
jgi:hypothetical protein